MRCGTITKNGSEMGGIIMKILAFKSAETRLAEA